MAGLCAAGIALASVRPASTVWRHAEATAARRLDDEYVAAAHSDLEGRSE
jgi:hypothetical protein